MRLGIFGVIGTASVLHCDGYSAGQSRAFVSSSEQDEREEEFHEIRFETSLQKSIATLSNLSM